MSNLPDLEPAIPATDRPVGTRVALASVATRFVLPRIRHLSAPRPPISTAVWTCNESGSYRFEVDARSRALVSRYFGENMVGSYEPNMGAVYPKLLEQAVSVSGPPHGQKRPSNLDNCPELTSDNLMHSIPSLCTLA